MQVPLAAEEEQVSAAVGRLHRRRDRAGHDGAGLNAALKSSDLSARKAARLLELEPLQ
jgi:hypothetical protein